MLDALQPLRKELATANHILFDQGVLDGFGHVSVRHPERADRFLLSRNLAPALVTPDDVLAFDLDGEPIEGKGEKVYLERFIHGEIYRARPDVGALVHSHVASLLPFGIAKGVRLCPVCHMGGFIKPDVPLFEIRSHAGEASDLLIRNAELGRHLARSLGDHTLVLMRGHGVTVVGASLRQAVFRAVYTEANARIQTTALGLGPITCLTADEADAANAANDGQIGRAWDFGPCGLAPGSPNPPGRECDDHHQAASRWPSGPRPEQCVAINTADGAGSVILFFVIATRSIGIGQAFNLALGTCELPLSR